MERNELMKRLIDGYPAIEETLEINGSSVPVYISEFWTSRQRQAANLHEIAYRACFKPALARFFIDKLSSKGDRVYDPFSGRGTTVLEAALSGRNASCNDVNPISRILIEPRLNVPEIRAIIKRLLEIPYDNSYIPDSDPDLKMFYHPDTLNEILQLREWMLRRVENKTYDDVDAWIRMVATNRLSGHSPGFFSVYTLPPNQACSRERQIKINAQRGQNPAYRDTKNLILRKSKQLQKGLTKDDYVYLHAAARSAVLLTGDARNTQQIAPDSVQLTITSPPFLDIVQYARDNWLRCWFNHIDAQIIERGITMANTIDKWNGVMQDVFHELYRITKRNGYVAFEVGEVHKGNTRLETSVVPLGLAAGFQCAGILINEQEFTKTSNIWGVDNNSKGTNSNRIVVFRKG